MARLDCEDTSAIPARLLHINIIFYKNLFSQLQQKHCEDDFNAVNYTCIIVRGKSELPSLKVLVMLIFLELSRRAICRFYLTS